MSELRDAIKTVAEVWGHARRVTAMSTGEEAAFRAVIAAAERYETLRQHAFDIGCPDGEGKWYAKFIPSWSTKGWNGVVFDEQTDALIEQATEAASRADSDNMIIADQAAAEELR